MFHSSVTKILFPTIHQAFDDVILFLASDVRQMATLCFTVFARLKPCPSLSLKLVARPVESLASASICVYEGQSTIQYIQRLLSFMYLHILNIYLE